MEMDVSKAITALVEFGLPRFTTLHVSTDFVNLFYNAKEYCDII